MEREVDGLFDRWADGGFAAPLAVTGIRGCGKTRSVADFLRRRGLRATVLDYEGDGLRDVLAGTNAKHAASSMATIGKGTLSEGDIVVIDGLRTCEDASASARMLMALSETFKVIAICNRHGALGAGFEEIRMRPMSFREYLAAVEPEYIMSNYYENSKVIAEMYNLLGIDNDWSLYEETEKSSVSSSVILKRYVITG